MEENEKKAPDGETAGAQQAESTEKPKSKLGCCGIFVLSLLGLVTAGGLFSLWWISKVEDASREFARQVETELDAEMDLQIAVPPDEDAGPLYGRAWGLHAAPVDRDNLYSVENMYNAKAADLEKYMADNVAYRAALKNAVLKPRFGFRVDLSKGISAAMPDLVRFREAARYLGVAARYEARKGNTAEALQLLGISLRLARDVGANRTVICRMLQVACEAMTVQALEHVLNEGRPSEAELRKFLGVLEAHIRGRSPLSDTLRREKIWMAVTIKGIVAGEVDPAVLTGGTRTAESQMALGLWRASGLVLKEGRNLTDAMDRYTEAARKPFPESLSEVEKIDKDLFPQSGGEMSGVKVLFEGRTWVNMLVPSFGRILITEARVVAQLELARLAIACRLQKLRTGSYPAKLEELSKSFPKGFAELPPDPFTAGDMKYRLTRTGCMIWSLGANRADDGGLKRTRKNRNACDVVISLDN